jgi:hypothetical protein
VWADSLGGGSGHLDKTRRSESRDRCGCALRVWRCRWRRRQLGKKSVISSTTVMLNEPRGIG